MKPQHCPPVQAPMQRSPGPDRFTIEVYRRWTSSELRALVEDMPNAKDDIEKLIHKLEILHKCHNPNENNIDVALNAILGSPKWKHFQRTFDQDSSANAANSV